MHFRREMATEPWQAVRHQQGKLISSSAIIAAITSSIKSFFSHLNYRKNEKQVKSNLILPTKQYIRSLWFHKTTLNDDSMANDATTVLTYPSLWVSSKKLFELRFWRSTHGSICWQQIDCVTSTYPEDINRWWDIHNCGHRRSTTPFNIARTFVVTATIVHFKFVCSAFYCVASAIAAKSNGV